MIPTSRPTGDRGRGPFPNYLEISRRVPLVVWSWFRVAGVAVFAVVCLLLLFRPDAGLFIFWRVLVPLLPLIFFAAPGLWRNVCPLATANQLPRVAGFSRGGAGPTWLKQRGFSVAIGLFLLLVTARKPVLDKNGAALAGVLLAVIVAAFAGGLFLKGKSGWCSSLCPLLPVQRLYGQTPLATVSNSHCQPCVGCTKNCYDFNPRVAYQADMYDPDPHWSGPRKLFAGAFPGLVIAYFTVPAPPAIATPELAARFAAHVLISGGSFFVLDSVLRVTASKLAALYGVLALNLFYWFSAPRMAATIRELSGVKAEGVVWPIRVGVFALGLIWLVRTARVERRFIDHTVEVQRPHIPASRARAMAEQVRAERQPEILILPEGRRVAAPADSTLLEILEGEGLPVEAGCRMGLCGSDPVAVVSGGEALSPLGDDEAKTLRRLGLAANARLACSAHVSGDVCVSLTLERAGSTAARPKPNFDPYIRSVVVLGNGIAGVTAADLVRREHPECEIHLVGREPHALYNRMAISRMIYGRSAMHGLYLLPEGWYEDHRINCWLNTRAQRIDLCARQVTLGTGERLVYDRLILAMGSSSFVPAIPGYRLPGSFVLREAEDAIAIRAWVQDQEGRLAVVLGGGLLGLEAAHALRELGLSVAVVERNDRLLHRQVDVRCSALLTSWLATHGIAVLCGAASVAIEGDGRVERVCLDDRSELPCDVVVTCAGIRPNADIAREAGIRVNRGVVVDVCMRTSAPDVYAAGDVAELEGQVLGLWPMATGQAEVAARNALGGDDRYERILPVAILKGVGIDVTSVGRISPQADDEVIVLQDAREPSYGKLVISAGRLVGAVLLNRPRDSAPLIAAVKIEAEVGDRLDDLRQGRWAAALANKYADSRAAR